MARLATPSGRRRIAALVTCLLLDGAFGSPAAVCAGEIDTLLFGSLDAGAASFLTVGAKIAFEKLDRPGFAVLASAGGGRRSETSCACATVWSHPRRTPRPVRASADTGSYGPS